MIDKAGHVVTNYHVVAGARAVEVSFSNNESLKARIVGTDPSTDVAVLQVDAHSRALTPLNSATPTKSTWATPWSRSAIRSASTARSRPGS